MKSVRRPVTAEGLLADIGARFASGLTADGIATLGGAAGAIRAGKGWKIDLPQLELTAVVVGAKANEVTSWVIVHVTPDSALRVKDLVRMFGPYRKLPPGEYTTLIFRYLPPERSGLVRRRPPDGKRTASQTVVVRFQKPWGAVTEEAPGPRRSMNK